MKTSQLERVAAVAAVAVVTLTLAGRPADAATAGTWIVVSSPNPSLVANSLHGVTSSGPFDAWSVGSSLDDTSGAQRTLTQHWDGAAWRTVDSPNTKLAHNTLQAVSKASPTDLWAVGYAAQAADDPDQGTLLVLRGDGVSWSRVPVEAPGASSALAAVDMIGTSDGWAVGSYHRDNTARQGLAMHWTGDAWRQVDTPDLGRPYQLTGVSATGANDVWAVGYTDRLGGDEHAVILKWDGQSWHDLSSPDQVGVNSALFGVSVVSSSEAWTVGYQRAGAADETGVQAYALRWSGRIWQQVPTPAEPGTQLRGVVARPAGVWAAGYRASTSTDTQFMLSFNRTELAFEPLPVPPVTTGNVTGTALSAIAETAQTGELWTVGWQSEQCVSSCVGHATHVLNRRPS